MKSYTIQSTIMSLLLQHEVKTIGDDKVKVGLSYDEILQKVHLECKNNELLPDECNTSKDCISWYSSKMKNESTKYFNKDIIGIHRPRKSNKKAAVKSTKVAKAK